MRPTRIHHLALRSCLTLLSLFCCIAPALAVEADDFDLHAPVPDEELNSLRGGFVTADGLDISIGLEKAIYIDGVLHSTQTVSMDTAGVQPEQLNAATLAFGSIIQSGLGNEIHASLLEAMAAHGGITIVQNTLDDQLIQQINQMDIVVSNYRNFTTPEIGNMLEHMIIQTLR